MFYEIRTTDEPLSNYLVRPELKLKKMIRDHWAQPAGGSLVGMEALPNSPSEENTVRLCPTMISSIEAHVRIVSLSWASPNIGTGDGQDWDGCAAACSIGRGGGYLSGGSLGRGGGVGTLEEPFLFNKECDPSICNGCSVGRSIATGWTFLASSKACMNCLFGSACCFIQSCVSFRMASFWDRSFACSFLNSLSCSSECL